MVVQFAEGLVLKVKERGFNFPGATLSIDANSHINPDVVFTQLPIIAGSRLTRE